MVEMKANNTKTENELNGLENRQVLPDKGIYELKRNNSDLLASRTKTIKVEVRVWDLLKQKKRENETFNDVIKGLLMERTMSLGNENLKAIKYKREIGFFDFRFGDQDVGLEFEYNDVKGNKSDFVLDIKIKKVFFGKRSMSPSEFFGVDNAHMHYSNDFLEVYLYLVRVVLLKEFKISFTVENLENITAWKKLYYEYSLSEESFKSDIEEPLRLNEEEKPSQEWKKRAEKSLIAKLRGRLVKK